MFGENSAEEANNNLGVDMQTIEYLRETGKWAKFLTIIGFIVVSFLVLFILLGTALALPLTV